MRGGQDHSSTTSLVWSGPSGSRALRRGEIFQAKAGLQHEKRGKIGKTGVREKEREYRCKFTEEKLKGDV